ncbi:MAG: sensor histidine kinase [Pseudomonadota bacterium]
MDRSADLPHPIDPSSNEDRVDAPVHAEKRVMGHVRAGRKNTVSPPRPLDQAQPQQAKSGHAALRQAKSGPVENTSATPSPAAKPGWFRQFGRRLGRKRGRLLVSRFLGRYVFTSLTQRIIILNLGALVVLLSGILFLNQFRDSLIEAREESLLTQGEIIAAAISARATVDTDNLTIDPDRLLELQAGESTYPMQSETENLDFPINPEEVAPVLRRLISPTRTRARIYDRDGLIILDSDRLYSRGQILRYDLPPVNQNRGFLERTWLQFRNWFWQSDLPIYKETPDGNGTAYGEVVTALTGSPGSETRRTAKGETIVSVAVPVQRFRAVLGVLLLSTEAGDIDKIIEKERIAIVRVFVVAALVAALLSVLLASTIARPLRKLSAAAERVRLGVKSREQIPDFSDRRDEIGHLSTSLGDMTRSLYARMDAIESFAADVSHELKNPLTSLRSAVETLPLAKKPEQRARLLDIIHHDVHRLDRLISDISDASRLDAELAREDAEPVDLAELLRGFHNTYTHMSASTPGTTANVTLHIEGGVTKNPAAKAKGRRKTPADPGPWFVSGHAGRLGQVMANLIENARSFVPAEKGTIDMALVRQGHQAVITVRDNGPGIPPANTERIFERFYTDRPEGESFGQNSGLGLSITRQIVEAHGGTINADNRADGNGACFTVRLPLTNP